MNLAIDYNKLKDLKKEQNSLEREIEKEIEKIIEVFFLYKKICDKKIEVPGYRIIFKRDFNYDGWFNIKIKKNKKLIFFASIYTEKLQGPYEFSFDFLPDYQTVVNHLVNELNIAVGKKIQEIEKIKEFKRILIDIS